MGTWGSELWRSVRTHVRRPAVAVVTSISIGLGVGVATTMFSIGHSLLGRALSVDEPERVVRAVRDAAGVAIFSGPELERLQAASAGAAEWVGHQTNEAVYRIADAPPAVAWFEIVGPRYFELFGTGTARGRYPSDEGGGAHREVLLSHVLWTRLGADPSLVGEAMTLNGELFTITGVASPGFRGTLPSLRVDLWAPLAAQPVLLPRSGSLVSEQDRFLFVTGRLLPGSDRDRLNARLAGMMMEPIDGAGSSTTSPRAEEAAGLVPRIQRVLAPLFVFLSALVGLVLLIACANIAGILLSRGAERLPELSTRAALGASRGSLARLLVFEGLSAGLAGAALGVALAWIGISAVRAFPLPAGVPLVLDPRLETSALVFALLLSLGVVLVASLVPAIVVSVRAGSRGPLLVRSGRLVAGLRRLFVGGQIGLATLLVAVSLLLARGVMRVSATDPGFRVDGVLTLRASADLLGYTPEQVRTFWGAAVEEARSLPGVSRAGAILFAPLGNRADRVNLDMPGSDWAVAPMLYNEITEGALEVLGLEVIRGRAFSEADADALGVRAVLVNEALARSLGDDVVGRSVRFGHAEPLTDAQVVGVVEDSYYRRLGEAPTPHVYLPFGSMSRGDMMLLAAVEAAEGTVASALRVRICCSRPGARSGRWNAARGRRPVDVLQPCCRRSCRSSGRGRPLARAHRPVRHRRIRRDPTVEGDCDPARDRSERRRGAALGRLAGTAYVGRRGLRGAGRGGVGGVRGEGPSARAPSVRSRGTPVGGGDPGLHRGGRDMDSGPQGVARCTCRASSRGVIR